MTYGVGEQALRAYFRHRMEDTTTNHAVSLKFKLFDDLCAHFNEQELRTLCFFLDVDYDSLPADGKTGKIRELIIYHISHDDLETLRDAIAEQTVRLKP